MSTFCCEALREAMRRWDRPFYYPLRIKDRTIVADRLCLQMYNVTPSGKMSKRDKSWAMIEFCPFCGKRLVPEDDSG